MTERKVTFRVEWGETDAAGIVYYPNYYRWFDQGTHELFRVAGYSVRDLLEDGFAIPLVEAHAGFSSALRYGDEVELVTRVAEIRRRTFRIEHTVSRDGEVSCEGHEERIWVRVLEGDVLQAEPIPDAVRTFLTGTDPSE